MALDDKFAVGPNDELRLDAQGRVVIGGGAPVTGLRFGTVAVDPGSLAAGAAADTDVTVAGLTTSDKVFAAAPADLEDGLVLVAASVPAADTLRIRLLNTSAGAIDGASKSLAYLAVR